jgi:glycosyltransferase involved in cell wall biosynthesis
MMLDLAAAGGIAPGKVYLYFHWVRLTRSKQAYFRRMAQKHPNLVILGTTPTVEKVFRDCGFIQTLVVPYPATMDQAVAPQGQTAFRHVLFAGAARADKGFGKVVDLVAWLAQHGESIAVSVQVSADHYDKYDAVTRSDIDRLRGIPYPALMVRSQALSEGEYAALFAGGICLQPYDRGEFADRVSSVTLDAFTAGCPVITVSRTWMARAVERFDAGIVVEDPSAQALHEAITRVIADYPRYQANARSGADVLRRENSWGRLVERLNLATRQ